MGAVHKDPLRPFRDAVDTAPVQDAAAFARATRNGVAQAILAAALAPDSAVSEPEHEPPEPEIRLLLGADLAESVSALYRGGDAWTSRAIELLEPLNDLAHVR